MKEPILWFLIAGAVLFSADNYFSSEKESIIVDEVVKNRLSSLWQAQMGSPATTEQLDSLTEVWVREEVMLREALRLNLDRDDTIIRRRLVQKLEFLAEGIEDKPPSADTLHSFYETNIADYSEPRRYSFSQIYFSHEARGKSESVSPEQLEDWKSLGEASMLHDQYIGRSKREIGNVLGRVFEAAVDSFVQGEWAGPFESSFGYHLVRLERVEEPLALPFASIEMKVLADYHENRRDEALSDYFQMLLERTNVEYR